MPTYRIISAKNVGSGKIYAKYGNATAQTGDIIVEPIPTDIVVTVNSSTTYNGSEKTLATATKPTGTYRYKLGYTKDESAIPSGGNIQYTNNYNTPLKATNAGTYHIYYTLEPQNENYYPAYTPNAFGNPNKIIIINKADLNLTSKNPDSIIYSLASQPVQLEVENISDSYEGNVKWPLRVSVKTSTGTTTWNCTEDGIITVPGGTKGAYVDYEISADVTISGDENYNSGTKSLVWKLKISYVPPINIAAVEEDGGDDFTYPEYVRLDDDVSFQILRTNPKLTTNTKLMYDGKNLFMESYQAEPILSTVTYKHNRVYGTGLYNKDLRKFLIGTNTASYSVGQDVRDTILLDNFDNQFENMYWCGTESINSDVYPQEMGCIAPLYLRKKRPNYFVIFKIDTPVNINLVNEADTVYDFKSDILEKAKIVKSFDLREGTPIGNYIKRYVEQKNFEYDKSIYMNFSSNEIYYYGIDKTSGVLTKKVENFEEQLLNNDNTIMKMDDWITSGFERNNLIFPYIINFEFLFDDKIGEYKFARYFGMYCNDIDLWEFEVTSMTDANYYKKNNITGITVDLGDDEPEMSEESLYYIKDKENTIYSIEQIPNSNSYSRYFKSRSMLDSDDFTGFELTSVSEYAERVSGPGRAIMVFEITGKIVGRENHYILDLKTTNGSKIGNFRGTIYTDAGTFTGSGSDYLYSCLGEIEDIAKALSSAINDSFSHRDDEYKWIYSYSIDNKIVIQARDAGTYMNELLNVIFSDTISTKINKLTDKFEGGTDLDGTIFKIHTEDVGTFLSENNHSRYLKCSDGVGAEILLILPYIHDGVVDDEYSLLITDNNGPKVSVSNTDEVEVIDKYYAKFGVLSFFPVKDFDFDTSSSAYGNDDMIQQELSSDNTEIKVNTGDSEDDFIVLNINHIPYGRFFYHNGNTIDTEYEYYFENLIPELCTVNKSVPHIVKWGYIDDSKDSCENPYRLNTSKIFEACNFSANTFKRSGDIMEYTHSMPYYINNIYDGYYNDTNYNNEYQYIPVSESMWELCKEGDNYDNVLNAWVTYFSNTETNNFEKMFGNTSERKLTIDSMESSKTFSNKRFNKKYSRFLLGNDTVRSSTLFRGVKFEIEELVSGKEVHTGKFNNYKFSFIYVPVCNIEKDNYTVHFIKNDKYKFIVGLVLFDIKNEMDDRGFNKAYVYAGSMYYINKKIN